MIESHPRLGFAVLGGVLVALVALVVIFVRGSAEVSGFDLAAAPSLVPAPQQAPEQAPQGGRTTRPSRSESRAPRRVDPAWAARVGRLAGIPVPAMSAYADAELVMAEQAPGCHLAWNTLAGIGWVESQHGTIDGRTLLADGRSSRPVIGPALDGSSYAAIRSTPTSRTWHDDATWEHAVGPLQFIASTWQKWGTDGDGDGAADPLDIDDAALTAADYLCADGHDLSTPAGWSAAVHSYNHDDAYVRNVLSAADAYAARTAS
ncbi:MAG: lytic transglycosylase domain-containing protein [Marmoricola sp.]